MPVQMPDGGKLPPHRATIQRVGKQFLDVFPYVVASHSAEKHAALRQGLRELREVARVRGDGQFRRPALHPQVVEKRTQRSSVAIRRHFVSMGCKAKQEKCSLGCPILARSVRRVGTLNLGALITQTKTPTRATPAEGRC